MFSLSLEKINCQRQWIIFTWFFYLKGSWTVNNGTTTAVLRNSEQYQQQQKKSAIKESLFWIEWLVKLLNPYLHHWIKRSNINFGRMCCFCFLFSSGPFIYNHNKSKLVVVIMDVLVNWSSAAYWEIDVNWSAVGQVHQITSSSRLCLWTAPADQ